MPGELAPLVAAAHELKSPLTLINHLALSLRDTQHPLTAAQQAQYLARLQHTSERMLRLVQQLSLSYRLDGTDAGFMFDLEPLSALEVCEAALHELGPYAAAHGQKLELKGYNCPHLVLAERDILHDIVTNLVDNAIRHSREGAVVQVSPQCRGMTVRLTVSDVGLTVPPRELKALPRTLGVQLQPFNSRSGTSGLGLYIAGQLARAMGGSLGVGRPEQGCAFFVDLVRSRQMSLL